MSVHSYFELATTLIGWHIGNSIAHVLASSGLIFLPFAIAIYRNWSGPIKSQESKSAAPVSLRRMEHDIYVAAVIMIFCFLPAVPIDPSEIEYRDRQQHKTVTAGDPDAPYMRSTHNAGEIRVPLIWWLAYQASSVLTTAAADAVALLGDPGLMRPVLMRIAKVSIQSEPLIREMREFRADCYDPSLAKYQNSVDPPKPENLQEAVDWLGSHLFLNTPGYYKRCTDVQICGSGYSASSFRPDWLAAGPAHNFQPGKPYCDAWWSHPDLGLRSKLTAELHALAPWLQGDLDRISKKFRESDPLYGQRKVIDHEDRFLRRIINSAPRVMVDRADNGKTFDWFSLEIFSIDGLQQILGVLGALVASAVFHVLMELLVIGLPMAQALMLMLVYISIPLVVPYAITNPSIIVRTVVIIFSLKFLSALWAVAAFLDEKLIETMYPDGSALEFGGTGTPEDVVLGLITLFSYISLPIAWFLLLSSVSSSAVSSLVHGLGNISQSLHLGSSSGLQTLEKIRTGTK
ncbi:MAG: conjugal transfer protein TraG N-terminal domain-containing protein [Acidiferrobacterales bacterium]|nr:conjugal transfer protein TraG N-terminal domain-containing protein [Acidiferrobacterales bacterium]